MNVYTYVCVYINVLYVYIHMYIDTYICIHIHTRIYQCIFIQHHLLERFKHVSQHLRKGYKPIGHVICMFSQLSNLCKSRRLSSPNSMQRRWSGTGCEYKVATECFFFTAIHGCYLQSLRHCKDKTSSSYLMRIIVWYRAMEF